MVPVGAKGGRRQGGGLRATDRGEVTATAAGGGARGSSWLGGAGDIGRSTQREVKGLKETSGGGAEGLADFG